MELKVWSKSGFTLRMWDTGRRDWRGQSILRYQLKDRRRVVFEGDDFAGSPLHADDSLNTVAVLLGFLTLQPGDTDREYFDRYTPDQMDWCQGDRAETLRYIQFELGERTSRR
jgi:hypothetical protein